MRILRVADVVDNRLGGMSRFMHETSDELRAMGHEVELAFTERLACEARGPMRRFALPRRVLGFVRERLREGQRYDVVDVHEPIAAAYAVARRLDRALPPLLVVSHGIEHRGHLLAGAYWRKKGQPVSLKSRVAPYSVIAQADLALRLADQITVLNSEDVAFAVERLGVARERVSLLHTAVSRTFLGAPPPDPAARGVLFLATWIARKGTLDLVPAMTRVLQAHGDLPFTVAGFGVGDDVVRGAFPEAVRGRIRLVRSIQGDEPLLRLYREHAAFVAPSVFEGQPLTVLEAAAAGLAIVTTGICGMKDFIDDGESGLLVEPGEPEALTRAIGRLVEEPALASRLGAKARARVRAFTWRSCAERFADAAERAVAHGRTWRR